MMEIAIGNTDRLVRLVFSILDLERISVTKPRAQIRACVQRRGSAATRGWVQQARTPRPNIPDLLRGAWRERVERTDRILQALNNLLSNTIKFSRRSGEIHLTARNLDEGEAIIEVRDQGHGIPADRSWSIFSTTASSRGCLGLARIRRDGLGLAICKSILSQHVERIWATSEEVRTTFHFTLPTKPTTVCALATIYSRNLHDDGEIAGVVVSPLASPVVARFTPKEAHDLALRVLRPG